MCTGLRQDAAGGDQLREINYTTGHAATNRHA